MFSLCNLSRCLICFSLLCGSRSLGATINHIEEDNQLVYGNFQTVTLSYDYEILTFDFWYFFYEHSSCVFILISQAVMENVI